MPKCRKCNTKLIVGETWYTSQAQIPNRVCIECMKAYNRQRYQDKPEYWQRYYEKYPDYQKQYHQTHREECLISSRQYYQDHREERLAYKRQYYQGHREERRQYYQEHRKERIAYSRQWAKDNPDKIREKRQRRRARKLNATIGKVDEAAIYERDKVCVYCGSVEDLTIDHVIPLAGGGPHCQGNLVVACRSCNCGKGNTPLEEWSTTSPGPTFVRGALRL